MCYLEGHLGELHLDTWQQEDGKNRPNGSQKKNIMHFVLHQHLYNILCLILQLYCGNSTLSTLFFEWKRNKDMMSVRRVWKNNITVAKNLGRKNYSLMYVFRFHVRVTKGRRKMGWDTLTLLLSREGQIVVGNSFFSARSKNKVWSAHAILQKTSFSKEV